MGNNDVLPSMRYAFDRGEAGKAYLVICNDNEDGQPVELWWTSERENDPATTESRAMCKALCATITMALENGADPWHVVAALNACSHNHKDVVSDIAWALYTHLGGEHG